MYLVTARTYNKLNQITGVIEHLKERNPSHSMLFGKYIEIIPVKYMGYDEMLVLVDEEEGRQYKELIRQGKGISFDEWRKKK